MNAPIPTERMIQRSIVKMLRQVFPRVFTFAVPNGAVLAGSIVQRSRQMGALLGDGLVKGTPDIVCAWGGKCAMIEVKRPKTGKLSDEQKKVHGLLADFGVPCITVTTLDEAYTFIRSQGAPWSGIDPRLDKSDPLWGAA